MKTLFNTWKAVRYLLAVLFCILGFFKILSEGFESNGMTLVYIGVIAAVVTFAMDIYYKERKQAS